MPTQSSTLQAIDSATNLPSSEVQQPRKERKQRISKAVLQVIDLLETGECKTRKAAAIRAGLHPDYVSRLLKKDHIRVFMERRARQTIVEALPRATFRMVELLDAKSEHVAADMSRHIAAIGGIKPAEQAQVSVNIDVRAGYIIDVSEPYDRAPVIEAKAE